MRRRENLRFTIFDLRLRVLAAFIVVFAFGAQVCWAAPNLFVPTTQQSATIGVALPITGSYISNASDNSTVSINASAAKGKFSLKQTTGLTFTPPIGGDGVDDAMMIFTGTLENINAAIETITYTATKSGVENLVVKVVDQGVAVDKTIVINIGSTGNNAPVFTNEAYVFSIPQNSANGTVVGMVSATDQDSNTLTYSITSGNTNNAFALNAASGQITVSNSAALTTIQTFILAVQVQDNGAGNLTDTASVAVNITAAVGKPGDMNADGFVKLDDVIRSAQVCGGGFPYGISTSGDVNQDGKIGPPEMVFGMEVVAGKRVHP